MAGGRCAAEPGVDRYAMVQVRHGYCTMVHLCHEWLLWSIHGSFMAHQGDGFLRTQRQLATANCSGVKLGR
jgi:hypothetical protein